MSYVIERVDDDLLKRKRARPRKRFREIADLEPGEGFRVPWTEMSMKALDPYGVVRTEAWQYGKELGRQFRTRVLEDGSMLLFRLS